MKRLVEIESIVTKMRDPQHGVEIKDRRYRGKPYTACFTAPEAIQWMMKNLEMTESEAVALGREMQQLGVIHHVAYQREFCNKEYWFRFQEDNKASELNFKKNWLKAARPAVEVSIDLLTRIAQIYYGNFKGGAIENKKRKEIRKNNDDYQKFTVATCELQKVEITKLDHDQKLAFFLNVLNTLALHSVIEADKIPEGQIKYILFFFASSNSLFKRTV